MKNGHVHFIINPASGNEEPILSYMTKAFKGSAFTWDASVTKQKDDLSRMARELAGKVDAIGIYGGDGSVAEVANEVMSTQTPLVIVPGGTANIFAKEMGIPQDSYAALTQLASGNTQVASIDIGLLNNMPFLIRANFGLMADMILEASRELKNKIGQLAYGVTALASLRKTEPLHFDLIIDGQHLCEQGVALTVTNCGNIGFAGYSLLPNIDIQDGLLDIILLEEANLSTLLKVAGSTLLQAESNVLKHWHAKEIKISLMQPTKIILDDFELTAQEFKIRIAENNLKVLVPKNLENKND